jgi:hypothetical protein
MTEAYDQPRAGESADDYELESPETGALFSRDGTYRYRLWRHWGDGCTGNAIFLLLNPSTAGATHNDATIRKCLGFASRWGVQGIRVVNLFAMRSTDPEYLLIVKDPIGPDNDFHIRDVTDAKWRSDAPYKIVCAWGAARIGKLRRFIEARANDVYEQLLFDRQLYCLGRCMDGAPRHPLMLSYDTQLEPWSPP